MWSRTPPTCRRVCACPSRFGRIDALVNNVGWSALADPVGTAEVLDRQINFNLKAVFLGYKHVLPVMTEPGRGALSVSPPSRVCKTTVTAAATMSPIARARRR